MFGGIDGVLKLEWAWLRGLDVCPSDELGGIVETVSIAVGSDSCP